jgi:hypothetical protein
MLLKRAGSPFWYVRYGDAGGNRVRRSTGTTNRKTSPCAWPMGFRSAR